MNETDLLRDAFGRVLGTFGEVVDGIELEVLHHRPGGRGNSIAWLLWHLTRVQDDHVAEIAGVEQVWTAEGWYERFALAREPSATGYGDTSAEVDTVRVPSADLLTGYHRSVDAMTARYLQTITPAELDRIIDRRFDPPVSVGVRLVSVVDDCIQHLGQAAYVRGVEQGAREQG